MAALLICFGLYLVTCFGLGWVLMHYAHRLLAGDP